MGRIQNLCDSTKLDYMGLVGSGIILLMEIIAHIFPVSLPRENLTTNHENTSTAAPTPKLSTINQQLTTNNQQPTTILK